MNRLQALLKKYWGHVSFRPHQREIITSVLNGRDVLAIMATGSGKSVCYQLPAVYLGGMSLVISPLISLMKDQVDDLNDRGIPAATYHSALSAKEKDRIGAEIHEGALRLLFVSPETCVRPHFLAVLKTCDIRFIAIDEAHCISEWGHHFRPEYRNLSRFRHHFPGVPVIALTATAVPSVRADITRQLGMTDAREFIGSFDRKNLRYRVVEKKDPLTFILNYVGQHRHDAGIIYCFSKKETEEVAGFLVKRGFSAAPYHAGMARQAREKVQEAFTSGSVPVICATVAFGMGIDKPDIRYVIHGTVPRSLESYYQETGRAGRDGRPGECILLYSSSDLAELRSLISDGRSGTMYQRSGLAKLAELKQYCETKGCRRAFLLRYFGEEHPHQTCGSCDRCTDRANTADRTDARLITDCIRQLGGNCGSGTIIAILRGSPSGRILENGFDTLPSFGSGREFSPDHYRLQIREMVRQGYLVRNGNRTLSLACGTRVHHEEGCQGMAPETLLREKPCCSGA